MEYAANHLIVQFVFYKVRSLSQTDDLRDDSHQVIYISKLAPELQFPPNIVM